jgi:hypothetical protein
MESWTTPLRKVSRIDKVIKCSLVSILTRAHRGKTEKILSWYLVRRQNRQQCLYCSSHFNKLWTSKLNCVRSTSVRLVANLSLLGLNLTTVKLSEILECTTTSIGPYQSVSSAFEPHMGVYVDAQDRSVRLR